MKLNATFTSRLPAGAPTEDNTILFFMEQYLARIDKPCSASL
jgi:hypothetical protein